MPEHRPEHRTEQRPRRRRHLPAALALATLLLVPGCAGTGAPDRGTLLVVGGGLRADNALVIGTFGELAGETALVLPTASGVPDESGPGTVEDLLAFAPGTLSVEVLEILAETPERAEDPRFVDPIEGADALWFTGGDQSRIVRVFRPDGFDTRAYRAVKRLLARDGLVAGTSAGAAMMSDPMIVGGSSREALLEGSGGGFELGRGMGFFTHGLVDQHFLRRGRVARLVVALEETGVGVGYGVADDRALLVDLERGSGRPLGEAAVLVVDVRGVERDGRSRRGVRVSLLSSGDEVDLGRYADSPDDARGAITFAPGKVPVEPIDDLVRRDHVPLDPFGPDAVTRLLERLSSDPTRPQRAESGGVTLVVRADERTRFAALDTDLTGFSVGHALLDLLVDDEAVLRADEDARELRRLRRR